MAKKIGLILALDGERKFKDDVTACGRSIGTLNSEMNLLKEESKGQANSLDALSKKHELLSRILDEHKKKETAVSAALDHARSNYQHLGSEIEKYEGELKQATETLDKMKASGNASEEQIKDQETAVKRLSDGLNEGREAYRKAGIGVSDWETKLNNAHSQTLKASNALDQNKKYLDEASHSADKCATSIDAFGKKTKETVEVSFKLKDALLNNVVGAFVDTAKELGKDVLTSAVDNLVDLQEAQNKFKASTGAANNAMVEYGETMKDIYMSGYGETMKDIADQMAIIKQNTNETDPDKLKDLTTNAIAFADTFDTDLSESIRGVNGLVENMGVSYEKAFDLMAKGAQNGLNKTDELGDNIAEYSQLWGQAGFSAEEMFAILDNGLTSGAYNLDKVNDFVKEFGISLSDGRIEKNLDSFSIGTQNLFYQWKNGEATTRDVFYSIIGDLSDMINQQEALTIASNTWSSLGEDNAMKVLTSLDDLNLSYQNVGDTMKKIKDIRYDDVANDYKVLGRTLQTEVITPLLKDFLPVAQDGMQLLTDNIEMVKPVAIATGSAMAAAFAVKHINDTAKAAVEFTHTMGKCVTKVLEVVGARTVSAAATAADTAATVANTAATEASTVAHSGLIKTLMSNPYALAAAGAAALTVAVVTLIKKEREQARAQEELYVKATELSDMASDVTGKLQDATQAYTDNIDALENQKTASADLVNELYDLSGQSKRSTSDISRMKVIVSELNSMYPDLALSIDESTGAISKNREETEKSIKSSLELSKAQAAQEKMADISQQLAEADMARADAANNLKDIESELSSLEEERQRILDKLNNGVVTLDECMVEYNNTTMTSSQALSELSERETILNEARDKQKESIDELNAQYDTASEKWTQAQEYIDSMTASAQENSGTMQENANTYSSWSQEVQEHAVSVSEAYTGMHESLSDVISSQMDMFEEFDHSVDLSTEQLLSNMQSQIEGVENWETNLTELANRGINENLLQYLAEMGPEGAGYVSVFAEMTDDELKQASEMWEQSLDLKDVANEKGSEFMSAYAESVAGGAENMKSLLNTTGYDSVSGLVDGIASAMGNANEQGQQLGQTTVDGANAGAGCHSPSVKTMETGKNIIKGLINGMRSGKSSVNKEAQSLSKGVTDAFKNNLSTRNLSPIGKTMVSGITQGMSQEKGTLIRQATTMANEIRQSVSKGMTATAYASFGKNIPTGVTSGINAGKGSAVSAAYSMNSAVRSAASSGSLYNAGYNLAVGMANGIYAGKSRVVNAAIDMANSAVNAARNRLGIHSPSTVFAEIGGYMAEGLAAGYGDEMDNVRKMIGDSMNFDMSVPRISGYQEDNMKQVEAMVDKKIASHGHDIYIGKKKIVGELLPEIDKRNGIKTKMYERS